MNDIIKKIKSGVALSYEELDNIFSGYLNNKVSDDDMTVILKLICKYGLSDKEVFDLVDIFINSGDVFDVNYDFIDKHSTGGVGDKTTLIVLPILASLGVNISKMSGRALGYTGGTIDKLNSIGVKTDLSKDEFYKCIDDIGMVISSQTDNLCPMDKKVYALRDVTGTTKSIPLIATSIMSKKIASGAGKILLDVKVGKGALVNNLSDARKLANLMIRIGKKYKREVVCIISDMNNPLGDNVGNKIEILEVVDILKNGKRNDLSHLCTIMASIMLEMSKGIYYETAKEMVLDSLNKGLAYDKFCLFVKHQGGNLDIKLPKCKKIVSQKSGYVKSINSMMIGNYSNLLGAGRVKKDDEIDYNAGIILKTGINSYVRKGDVLAEIYGNTEKVTDISDAFRISKFKSKKSEIIIEIIR